MSPLRRKRLARLHIAARERRLIDGDDKSLYRDWLQQKWRVTSATQLNDDELRVASLMLTESSSVPSTLAQRPLLQKINALLLDQGKSWMYCEGITMRMFNKERVAFCSDQELRKVVAALTYHQRRQAGGA